MIWTRVLVFRLWRGRRPGLGPALAAALCVSTGLVVWALAVAPVNAALNGWTAATLPADWSAWLDRGEAGHAVHAARPLWRT